MRSRKFARKGGGARKPERRSYLWCKEHGGSWSAKHPSSPTSISGGGLAIQPYSASPTIREKDEVTLPDLPAPSKFRHWKTTVRKVLASASSDPDDVFRWIFEVDKEHTTIDQFYDSGKYQTLDANISAAVEHILTGYIAPQAH